MTRVKDKSDSHKGMCFFFLQYSAVFHTKPKVKNKFQVTHSWILSTWPSLKFPLCAFPGGEKKKKIIIYKAHLKYESTQWVCNNSSLSHPLSLLLEFGHQKWVFKSHIIALWSASHWQELFRILKTLLVLLEVILDIYNWWCMISFQKPCWHWSFDIHMPIFHSLFFPVGAFLIFLELVFLQSFGFFFS